MKFWTTGRIDEKIDFEIFQPVMLRVESQIEEVIHNRDYGDEIESYDIVINIFEEKGDERFKYGVKKRETDIDVNIEHDDFLNGDFNKRCELYLRAVLHSIDRRKLNKHLTRFKFEDFARDISSLINNYTSPSV